ncbi:MAG: hypothetical protein WKF67_02795 [Rubrobacteraceae bacterium]
MSRVRRVVAGGVVSALMLSVAAFPALAIGDGPTPAGECANSTSAVGTPQGGANPGFDNTGGRISAPVSKNNPGQADTIAQGDVRSGDNSNNCQSAA